MISPRSRTTVAILALTAAPALTAAQTRHVEAHVAVAAVEQGRTTTAQGRGQNRQNRNFRAEQTARETHTLAIGANGQLELKNISGDIVVTAGGGNRATVEVTRTSHGRTPEDAQRGLDLIKATVTERGNRATIETQYPNERQPAYSVDVDYRVTAPAGTSLAINSISGDVQITGITGATSVEVISGDVTLQNVSRLSSAKTASGDIMLTNVGSDGTLEAGSMSGDVTLAGVKAARIAVDTIVGDVSVTDVNSNAAAVKSMSGDVTFAGTLTKNGRYEFQSHSGSVRLTLMGGSGFDLTATTFAGSIRPEAGMELKVSSQNRRELRAAYGDGGAVVVATTFSGSIVINRK